MSDQLHGDDEYDDIAALLRGLPDASMPDEVWTRLATALSAEAGATPIRPVAAPRRRRWVPAALGAGAAAVAVGIAVPLITVGGANVADGPAKETSAAVSLEPVTLDTVPARYVVSTGTDYSEPAMSTQVSGLLGTVGLDSSTEMTSRQVSAPKMAPVGMSTTDMTTDMTSLHDCLAALAGSAASPPALVVDRATFGGGEAAIVVFLHGQPVAGKATVDVIVVNPACTPADRDAARRMTVEVATAAP